MITDYLKNGTLPCQEIKNWKKEFKKTFYQSLSFLVEVTSKIWKFPTYVFKLIFSVYD